jgi:serine/threonine protein kinase
MTEHGFNLLSSMLSLDPKQRPSASHAENHPWFIEFPPAKEKTMMPSFPAKTTRKDYQPDNTDALEAQLIARCRTP